MVTLTQDDGLFWSLIQVKVKFVQQNGHSKNLDFSAYGLIITNSEHINQPHLEASKLVSIYLFSKKTFQKHWTDQSDTTPKTTKIRHFDLDNDKLDEHTFIFQSESLFVDIRLLLESALWWVFLYS